jgi:hypothetical protein
MVRASGLLHIEALLEHGQRVPRLAVFYRRCTESAEAVGDVDFENKQAFSNIALPGTVSAAYAKPCSGSPPRCRASFVPFDTSLTHTSTSAPKMHRHLHRNLHAIHLIHDHSYSRKRDGDEYIRHWLCSIRLNMRGSLQNTHVLHFSCHLESVHAHFKLQMRRTPHPPPINLFQQSPA